MAQEKPSKVSDSVKNAVFWFVAIITVLYVIIELIAAIYINSLSLISDGFHNLSDVFAIYIAYYSAQVSKRKFSSDSSMSYGWARSEVLGGLTNGCFLFALCLYIVLETIPRIIEPEKISSAKILIWTAVLGVIINTVGSIGFAFTGISHGHSHSHGHDHGHDDEHGHDHEHGDEHDHKRGKEHDHNAPGHNHDHNAPGHSHDHNAPGHSHDHNAPGHSHDHTAPGHSHDHNAPGHSHDHNRSHDPDDHSDEETGNRDIESDMYQSQYYGTGSDEGSSGSNSAEEGFEPNGSPLSLNAEVSERLVNQNPKKKKKKTHSHDSHDHSFFSKFKLSNLKLDLNVGAVFLHYVGDMFSSLLVVISGVLIEHFDAGWTLYVDPVTSLLIVVLIFLSTWPLVQRACLILMQSTPDNLPMKTIRKEILKVPNVLNLHDLHVWQLVDDLAICSMHVSVSHDTDFNETVETIKEVLHKYGIHSSAIQPEFSRRDETLQEAKCRTNCVETCEADWCCKSVSESDAESDFPDHN